MTTFNILVYFTVSRFPPIPEGQGGLCSTSSQPWLPTNCAHLGLQTPCFLISPTENLPWEGWSLTPSHSKLQMISQKAHPSFYSTIVSQNSQGVYINKKKSLTPPPSSSINCKFSLNFCLNSTRHLFGLTHRIQYLIHLIQINMFFFLFLFYKPTTTTPVYQHRL